jgi:hypothetical protein
MRFALLLFLLTGSPPLQAQQICDRQAGQLLGLLGLSEDDHQILKENLATYLFNLRQPVPSERLNSLDAFRSWLKGKEVEYRQTRTVGSNELGRWPGKFYVTLERPYSDQEAGRHLDRIVQAFKHQCSILEQSNPGYPREFFAFGGLVQGRFGVHSDLDYFFNDPRGEKGSRPFVVPGLCRGLAFDAVSFAEHKAKAQAGEQNVIMGGPAYPLPGSKPWKPLRSLIMNRMGPQRGLDILTAPEGWKVRRVAYPARSYEDPASDLERSQPL